MLSISEIVKTLENLVRIPLYGTLGITANNLVYLSTQEGIRSLWSINLESKSVKRLTVKPVHEPVIPTATSPYIIFTRDVAKGKELHKVFYTDVRSGKEELLADTPLMRIFGIAFDGSKVAFTGATAEDTAIYLAKMDSTWEKLVKLEALALVTDVSDRYVVGFGNLRRDPKTYEIFILDLETNEFKVYTPKEGSQNKDPRILKETILFESNFEGVNRLYFYDPKNNTIEKVKFSYNDYDDFNPIEHDAYGWTIDGKVWAVGKRNGRSRLFVDGKEIPTPLGTIHGIPAFTKDRVFVAVSSLVQPPRILEIDLKNKKTEIIIDNVLPKELRERFGEVKFVKYKSFDGLEIPAYIVESKIATKPGPSAVYVHGGPWAEVRDLWSIFIASLVTSGYHVLAPNFRGSTGYGDDFRVLDIGDPGGGDLQDIVYIRSWAVKNGIADEKKVSIIGYSYGGYMTLLAMGKHPDLWRCGVAGASISDWEEMYGLSDDIFRKTIEILFAGKKDLFKERSPITYVDKVSGPLCIIHPQNDTRTPLKPILRYMNKLLELGKTFEAHIAPDMGHFIAKMDDAVKILLPALIFLERHLKK